MKLKNNGSERIEKNFIGEAVEYWRNCVIGEKVKNDDGSVTINKDSKKNYKKSKVVLGTIVGGLAAIATGAGVVVGVDKLKNRNEDETLYLPEEPEIPTIESGEETTVE